MRSAGAWPRLPSHAELDRPAARAGAIPRDVSRRPARPRAVDPATATARSTPSIDPAVLAAYTATAGVILNLDETITLE